MTLQARQALRMVQGGILGFMSPRCLASDELPLEGCRILSLDLFDTLICRPKNLDDLVSRGSNAQLVSMLKERGWPAACSDIMSLRRKAVQRLRLEASKEGRDPEILRLREFETVVADLVGAQPDVAAAIARTLVDSELDRIRRTSKPSSLIRVIAKARQRGLRVVVISDSFYSRDDLARLLERLEVPPVDRVYSSGDEGVSKFRGGLFRHMLRQEGVAPGEVLHLGDNLASDYLSPRSEGLRACWTSQHSPSKYAVGYDDLPSRFGFETLGPVFLAFAQLLLVEAKRRKFQRLAFVSRDGDLLLKCTREVAATVEDAPELDYVYLSRRATALSATERLDSSALRAVEAVRSEGALFGRVLAWYGLSPHVACPQPIDPNDRSEVLRCIETPEFRRYVAEERRRQRGLLFDYLRQSRLIAGRGVALVDIGWRGTTQSALNRAFFGEQDWQPIPFLYLGLWNDLGKDVEPLGAAHGILMDQGRRLAFRESGAWHASLLLEAICRASHSTVVGYRREETGLIVPILASHSDDSELEAESRRLRIREGILSFVGVHGPSLGSSDPENVLREAQRRLLRLAFFPHSWELKAVSGLVHTEGNAPFWRAPMVQEPATHPMRAPRMWMRGLSSPWRGGYVAATGGPLLSLAFCCLEAALTTAPPSVRVALRDWAVTASGARP